MKILLINTVKSKGSTGNVVTSLFKAYNELGYDTYFIYGRGSKIIEDRVYKPTIELESKLHHLLSLFTGNIYGGMHISTRRIINRVKKISPDIIHIHLLNGYYVNIYLLIKWLKKQQCMIIITMHADLMMSANCGIAMGCEKWRINECKGCQFVKTFNGRHSLNRTHHFYRKMYKTFQNFQKEKLIITGVSPWLTKRIKHSPIYYGFKVQTILNPVDDFFLQEVNVKKDDKQILYVTPDYYDDLKGSKYLVEIAKYLKEYRFVVVDAKEQEIDRLDNIEVIYHPTKNKLRELYHSSLCTLILSKVETFSMVALESVACRTPVVGFKNGGTESWLGDASFVEYGDVSNLIIKIKKINKSFSLMTNYKTKEDIAKDYLRMVKIK